MNAIHVYRLARALKRCGVPVFPRLLYWAIFLIYNSSIPPGCSIGPRSRFAYGGIGVVIHADCRIGSDVLIGQNVTIGGNFEPGVPSIGNNVYIAPGSRILGPVSIGDNVVIGANAVVLTDVPSNSVVGGIPAKVLRTIAPGDLAALAGRLERTSGS